MKVVFATGIFPPDIGGPATSVTMLAEAWGTAGHDVSVVTYSDAADDGVKRPYEVRRILRGRPVAIRYLAYLRALWKLADGPCAIFAQDAVASGLPARLVAALRRRRLYVKVVGDFAWEHAQVQGGYRDSLEHFQRDRSVGPVFWLMRFLQRMVARGADRVIVPSRYLAGVVRGWGVPEARIGVVYNGVHLPKIDEPFEKHPRRIFAAGRLVPWKNFDVLIKAMPKVIEKFPDATLMIAGDGPEMERLKALSAAPMLRGKINLVGRLKREEVCRAVAASSVFVLPSSYEGFSHQLIEAFACGGSVIASRAGGNTELMQEGKNGLLVEPGDVAGLAAAILRFLSEPEFAASCAREAGKDLDRFSVERQIAETTEIVLGKRALSVLMISRDPSVADFGSRSAERMRAYGKAVDALHVVALGRAKAAEVRLSPRVTAERVDVAAGPIALIRAIRAARRAARASEVTLVTAQDPFEAGIVGMFAARAARAPLLIEEHGGLFLSPYWRRESLKNACLYPIGLLLLGVADGIRCVSLKIKSDLERRHPKKKIREIPVFTEALACYREGKPHVFGYVGRFVEQKHLDLLLAAFASVARALPESRLLMVGAGPLEGRLRRLAAEYVVGDLVTWRPYSEKVSDAYREIGTLVLPSWYEGWGRVAIEAMSCGIPVVMTDVGCAGEMVRDGVEGRVVPVDDVEAFAKAMRDAADPARHPLLSAAAKRRSENAKTPETLASELVAFWKEIAGA